MVPEVVVDGGYECMSPTTIGNVDYEIFYLII